MLPLSENDAKAVAAAENVPELGKVRPYQVENSAVMVMNKNAMLRIGGFSTLEDGHYYFNHKIKSTGQTMTPYFLARPNPIAQFTLPLEAVKRLASELSTWSNGLGASQYVELTYDHDDKNNLTFLRLNAPGEVNKVADKHWTFNWERGNNKCYFRAVCNSQQLAFMLAVFKKMKDTENIPVSIALSYDPKAFEKSSVGKSVYNGIWFLDTEYLGHEVTAAYSTKSVLKIKDEDEAEEAPITKMMKETEDTEDNPKPDKKTK